jgi:hypothetical protein
MDPHHANPAFSISVLDQRHRKNLRLIGRTQRAGLLRLSLILSNVRAIDKPGRRNLLGMGLVLLR